MLPATHRSRPSYVSAKKSPNLKWSGKWLNPRYMVRFIANPHGVKPGTSMPNMLEHLDEAAQKRSAEAITHYLVAAVGNQFQLEPTDPVAARRGYELFHSVGCVACHSPRDQTAGEKLWMIPCQWMTFLRNMASPGSLIFWKTHMPFVRRVACQTCSSNITKPKTSHTICCKTPLRQQVVGKSIQHLLRKENCYFRS